MTAFDDACSLLDPSMVVVTTAYDGRRAGCLVGFSTQISIDPPRFLVGISDKNHTHGVAARADRLAVHLIDSGSAHLARLFGGETEDDVDKFARCAWVPGPGGVPVLADAPAWFGGPIVERVEAGDHAALVIEVDAAENRRHPTRVLRLTDVRDLDPGHQA